MNNVTKDVIKTTINSKKEYLKDIEKEIAYFESKLDERKAKQRELIEEIEALTQDLKIINN